MTALRLLVGLCLAGPVWAQLDGQANQLSVPFAPVGVADPNGLNPLHDLTRSPSGRLYPDPFLPPPWLPFGDAGWTYASWLEAGFVADFGDSERGLFQEYADLDGGALVHRFQFSAREREGTGYVRFDGGGIGRDDGYGQLQAGRLGRYGVRLFGSQLPHLFTTRARSVWDGVGGADLRLPAALSDASADTFRQFLAEREFQTLALERKSWGLAFDASPRRALKLSASAVTETRDGTRPFGGAMGYPGAGQFSEIIEPIDYRTTNLALGLSWTGAARALNLSYGASYFRNDADALRWDNPALSPFPFFAPPRGQLALAPDNDYQNLKVDFATRLPWWRSRLTATASFSEFEQDEALLPPTISSGLVSDGGEPVNLDLWNTVQALSRLNADAERGQRLLRLTYTAQPARRWRVKFEARDLTQDNDTNYLAFNALAQAFGSVALDGALLSFAGRGGIFQPQVPGSRVRIRNTPFEKDTQRLSANIDHRFSRRVRANLTLAQETSDYAFRERREVEDDILTGQLIWRGTGTLRLKAQLRERDGGQYVFNPYEPFFSSSLPGFTPEFADGTSPPTLSALRKYDLASHDRDLVSLKWLRPLGARMDLSLNARWAEVDFDADYGLTERREAALNVDWNYRYARHANLYAYLSAQRDRRRLAGIRANGGNTVAFGADPDPGGVNFPLENAWQQRVRESGQAAGLGWRRVFDKLSVNLAYHYSDNESRVAYEAAGAGALVRGVSLDAAGAGFPDLSFRHQSLEASVRWQQRRNLAWRVIYRFEKESIEDFHYLGLTDPVVEQFGAGDIYLGANPQDFSASVLTVLLEWSPES